MEGPRFKPAVQHGKRSAWKRYMSHCLNSLKGCYIRDYIGDYYRAFEGGY